MTIALSMTLLIAIGFQLYVITFEIIVFIRDITTVLPDVLAFIGVIYQVWGTWKLKRSLGLQSGDKDLVTSLLEQGILRICFVLVITLITTILTIAQPFGVVDDIFTGFQEVLSTLLLCDFTLALRRRNTKKSIQNPSDLHLPTLSMLSQDNPTQAQRSLFGRLHESLVNDMAERSDLTNPGNLNVEDPDVDYLQDNGYYPSKQRIPHEGRTIQEA
ncbi:hypothetical protein Clacol_000054 [Clathrus columnatus]|uniref:Uncharacterized protein n=1 Tax=Clathrus columnatus TaxID=1419009 RepID=A0AAV4ZW95_9AGAM|nr:hypothetical protein Clacol_000054 [Clathrus columnatus]